MRVGFVVPFLELTGGNIAVLEIANRLARQRDELAGLEADEVAATAVRDTAWTEIDADAARATAQRAGVADLLPRDLLELYEKIRADKGGVGAAALRAGRCEGCHLSLPGSDLAGIRAAPSDAVLRCGECRRILVRTAESGL